MPATVATEPSTAVTVDNFNRAETDMYFANERELNAFGKLRHYRELMPVEKQAVVRPNRDTLYSVGVFDLDAGPLTITMPDAGKRFMSMQTIDEEHYVVAVAYGAGTYTFSREEVGTRYLLTAFRKLIDPAKPGVVEVIRALLEPVRVHLEQHGPLEQ